MRQCISVLKIMKSQGKINKDFMAFDEPFNKNTILEIFILKVRSLHVKIDKQNGN
jgi:hypothetical protein